LSKDCRPERCDEGGAFFLVTGRQTGHGLVHNQGPSYS
jgi:hypothetical protein